MITIFSNPRKTILYCIVFLGSLFCSVQSIAQNNIDIGIFNSSQPGQFEIRLKPNYNVSLYLTNLQFTVKWPIQPNFNLNYNGATAPYSVLAQGQYQSGGYNYWVFVSPGGSLLNMTSGTEYICAAFSFTQPSCVSFEIAADSWTAQNNGDFYIEINGLPKTGTIYSPSISYTNSVSAAGSITGLLNNCQGNQAEYSVLPIQNAQSYFWSYTGSNVNIVGTGDTVNLQFSNLATSGYLTVAGVNSCGQGLASPPLYINVDPVPSITTGINGPSSVCAGSQNIMFSLPNTSQNVNYNWSTPSGFLITSGSNTNSIIVNLTPLAQTGTISVFLSNSCGSSDTIDMLVYANTLPNADAGTDTIIPFASFAILSAANSGISNCSYHWLPENKVVQAFAQNTQTVSLTNSVIYTLLVTDTITSCLSLDTKQVMLSGGPLSISPSISSDTICQYDSVQLFANACCGSGAYSYSWYSPDFINPAFQSNLANPWFTPTGNTSVILVVTDGFNQDTATLEVSVTPAPTAFFSSIDTICQNDSSAVTITFTGNLPYSFLISNNSTSISFTNISQNPLTVFLNQAGSYHILNFSDLNCNGIATGSADVTVTSIPVTPFISVSGIVLSSNYMNGNQWYNANGAISGAVNQQYTPTVNGIYYCNVTIDGCTSQISNSINVTSIGISGVNAIWGITAFPNPAINDLNLRVNSNFSEITIVLTNIFGQNLMNFGPFKDSAPSIKLDIKDLKPGIYFVSILEKGIAVHSLKFIKL